MLTLFYHEDTKTQSFTKFGSGSGTLYLIRKFFDFPSLALLKKSLCSFVAL